LKREYEKARDIKDKESILAIVGNPPYFNGRSQAKSDVIDAELYKYKQGLNEKKINLDDSYIKFIRFAEWKIERCGYGLVGIITNNSFLYGVTYRQMRRHLYETFDEIYVVNLHGDSDRKEPDKNIFDIKRGVSIVFLVKKIKPAKNKKVYYLSTLQHDIISRNQKLSFLENTEFTTVKWEKVKPTETANYWFISKDFSEQETYRKFWKLTDVFQEWNSGLESGNDDAAFFYTKKDLDDRCKDYTTLPEHILREKYGIKDKENWILKNAIEDLKKANNPQTLYYRPFDIRWTSLSKSSKSFLGRPRYEITKHFDNRENIGIVFKKELNRNKFNTILVVDKIFDRTILETSHGGAFVAPLYYYNGHKQNGVYELEFEDSSVKSDNFTPKFIKNYLQKLPFKPAPEEILAYIYAVLHSPVYRTKYLEFLKTDFPAVPMTANEEFFKEYANLGQQLIDLHLLRNLPNDKEIRVSFDFENNFTIEKIELSGENLFLNVAGGKTITISGITEAIYNFEIGSYRPIDKWLKYRIKDHVSLSISDLTHLKNMIVAIKGTIATMQEVENLGENYLQ
jgi:predicted helicase